MENKLYGFIPPTEVLPEQYVFGDGRLTGKVLRIDGQWNDFAIINERQSRGNFDTCACVVFSILNVLEYLIWTLYNEKVNYSDRWIILKAGVRCPGSDPHKVCEAIRKWGIVDEEDLPFVDNENEFYNISPEKMAELEKKGQDWLKRFSFGHEWLSKGERISLETIKQSLTFAPLPIGVVGWFEDNGFYVRPEGIKDNHFTTIRNYEESRFHGAKDSYEPFDKKLVWGYGYYWAKRITIEKKPTEVQLAFWQIWLNALFVWFNWIKREAEPIIKKNPEMDMPKEPEIPEPTQPEVVVQPIAPIEENKRKKWAEAITIYENMAKYHKDLNNPGAIKGKSGKFLKFDTYEEGFDYLYDYLTRACNGEHKAYKPNFTLLQFFEVYAPKYDKNNSLAYALWIAERLGVKIETQIKDLV